MDDFDEKFNDISDNKDLDFTDLDNDIMFGPSSDFGHSHIMENESEEDIHPLRSWHDLRNRMGDYFQQSGALGGFLRSVGLLIMATISLPVTLVKFILLREARPYDYEGKAKQINARNDLRAHARGKKEVDGNQTEKEEKENDLTNDKKFESKEKAENTNNAYKKESKQADYTNDSVRMRKAIDSLRTEEEKYKKNKEPYKDKRIAGLKSVSYSPKRECLTFYGLNHKKDDVIIDSKSLSELSTANKIRDILAEKERDLFRKKSELDSDSPLNPMVEKTIVAKSGLIAGLFLSAINYKYLDNDNSLEKMSVLSNVNIDGKDFSLKLGSKDNVILSRNDKDICTFPVKNVLYIDATSPVFDEQFQLLYQEIIDMSDFFDRKEDFSNPEESEDIDEKVDKIKDEMQNPQESKKIYDFSEEEAEVFSSEPKNDDYYYGNDIPPEVLEGMEQEKDSESYNYDDCDIER